MSTANVTLDISRQMLIVYGVDSICQYQSSLFTIVIHNGICQYPPLPFTIKYYYRR